MKYDVILLGSGPAGFYFAKTAAAYGKNVLMIEKELLGGTGFRTGCLPAKKYLDGLRQARKIEQASEKTWCQATVDRLALYKQLNQEIDDVEEVMNAQLSGLVVDLVYGDPEIISENSVALGDLVYEAEHIVLATGTKTNPIVGCEIDEEVILTHKGMIAAKDLPNSLIIVGGNVEGIEFASYLSGFGVDVTVIALGDELLEGTDRDLCQETLEVIAEYGGKALLNTAVASINSFANRAEVVLEDGTVIGADKVLITGTRSGNIPTGLNELGILLENTCIKVDTCYKTSIDSIYAIGDVNGLHGMAHIALQQGIQLADYLYGHKKPVQAYESLPRSIFTINEIAGAGLQEDACKAMGIKYTVKSCELKNTFRGWSKDLSYGKVKILFDENECVIGAWVASENASDYIGTIGLWIDRKITLSEIKASLFIHPSIGEGLLDAAIKM